jgi:trans-aconitate methyltransferase
MQQTQDAWVAASTYERFMGRWSRRLAREFVLWLHPAERLHWLDVGCGTGALTSAICDNAAPSTVVACDPAAAFVDYARTHVKDDRVSFIVAGVDDFPQRPGGYGSIASSLALNFFPNSQAAVERMRSAAASGGIVSACVWDYAEGMQYLRLFWDAALQVSDRAQSFDEAVRFPICEPGKLNDLFRATGLADVRCDAVDIPTSFANFDDLWRPLLGGTGPAPAFVASLSDAERAQLRENLRASVGMDQPIALKARAWAVSGVNP